MPDRLRQRLAATSGSERVTANETQDEEEDSRRERRRQFREADTGGGEQTQTADAGSMPTGSGPTPVSGTGPQPEPDSDETGSGRNDGQVPVPTGSGPTPTNSDPQPAPPDDSVPPWRREPNPEPSGTPPPADVGADADPTPTDGGGGGGGGGSGGGGGGGGGGPTVRGDVPDETRDQVVEDVLNQAGDRFTESDVVVERSGRNVRARIRRSAVERELLEDIRAESPVGLSRDEVQFIETEQGLSVRVREGALSDIERQRLQQAAAQQAGEQLSGGFQAGDLRAGVTEDGEFVVTGGETGGQGVDLSLTEGGGGSLATGEIRSLSDASRERGRIGSLGGLAPGSVLSQLGGGETDQLGRESGAQQLARAGGVGAALESQLEEEYGTDFEQGRDFDVVRTDDGFRAEFTEVGEARALANNPVERQFDVFRARNRETFFGGIESGVSGATEFVTGSEPFQATSRAVDRGTPDFQSPLIQRPIRAGEETFGAVEGAFNRATPDPDSPFFTAPRRAGEQSLDLVRRAPGGEAAAGVIAAGAPFALGEPTFLGEIGLGGAALITGGAVALGVASTPQDEVAQARRFAESSYDDIQAFASEIPVPEEGQAIRDQPEIAVPSGAAPFFAGELGTPSSSEPVFGSELGVPESGSPVFGSELDVSDTAPGQQDTPVGILQAGQQVGRQRQRDRLQDALEQMEQRDRRSRERLRRRQERREERRQRNRQRIRERQDGDEFAITRNFPTAEETVAGRDVSAESEERIEDAGQPDFTTPDGPTRAIEATEVGVGAGADTDVGVGVGARERSEAAQTPELDLRTVSEPGVGSRAGLRERTGLLDIQAQQFTPAFGRPGVTQLGRQATVTATAQAVGTPSTPAFEFPEAALLEDVTTPTGPGFGFPTPTARARPRPDGEGRERLGTGANEPGVGAGVGVDDFRAPGWLSETFTDIATFGSGSTRQPSQEALESQNEFNQLTGELPTFEELEGSPETQARIAEVRELFGGEGFDLRVNGP